MFDCDDECIRDNESICRTLDENDSRLHFADGGVVVVGVGGVVCIVGGILFVRVGDVFGVDIGIEELFRLDAFSEPSFRMLCAESGRYRLDGEADVLVDVRLYELIVMS